MSSVYVGGVNVKPQQGVGDDFSEVDDVVFAYLLPKAGFLAGSLHVEQLVDAVERHDCSDKVYGAAADGFVSHVGVSFR